MSTLPDTVSSGEAVSSGEEERYRALQELAPDAPDARVRLRAGLFDSSWRVRRAAAGGWARLADPAGAAEELVAVLGAEGETGARNAAAEALALLGRAALPVVLSLLRHPEADRRRFAADILGQVGLHDAEGPLVAALGDADPNVRLAAAEALGRVGAAPAVAALGALLVDREAPLQLAALEGLTSLRAPPSPEVLAPLLRHPLLRRSALRLLALTGAPAAAAAACRLLREVPTLEQECLAALGELDARVRADVRPALEAAVRGALAGGEVPLPALEAALSGPLEPAARGAILLARVLGLTPLAVPLAACVHGDALDAALLAALRSLGPGALGRLLPELERLPAQARERAGEVLPGLVGPSHLPELARLAGSPEPDLARLALRALGASGAAEALPPLLGALGRPPLDRPAARAVLALAERLPAEVRSGLEAHPEVPLTPGWVAVRARLEGPGALAVLRRALRDAAVEVRAAAAEAAEEVGGAAGLELVRVALADEETAVRLGAVRGLARLAGGPSVPAGLAEVGALVAVALEDADVRVRLAALDATGRGMGRVPAQALARLVSHVDARTAAAAVRALGRLDWLDGELLSRGVAHPDPEVVKEALAAGAHLPMAAALARGLLAHGRWDVRVAAARLLTWEGGPGALAAVEGALSRETDGMVRGVLEQARQVLGRG